MHDQCDDIAMVTFTAAQHHCPLNGTKSYCLVTEEQRCEQYVHKVGTQPRLDRSRSRNILITNVMPNLLLHTITEKGKA